MLDDFFENINSSKGPEKIRVYTLGDKKVVTKSDKERLELGLRLAKAALDKRKSAMQIMERRILNDEQLIQRMSDVLKQQDETITKQQEIIDSQQEKLNHFDSIVKKMESLKTEQAEIIKFSQTLKQANS